jgi:two-component system response regulator DevR
MIRTFIVHESRLLAELKAAALHTEPDIEVVGGVCTTQEELTFCQCWACDVMLVSATLPNEGALELTQTVRKSQPAVKVLLTGVMASKVVLLRYLEHGVAGYVDPEDAWPDVVQKIRALVRGEGLVAPALIPALIARLRELKHIVRELAGLQAMNPTTLYASLTEREAEVLALIEQGYTNLQIGAVLCIEAGTVKNHVHNLLGKLGVPTRLQAAMLARQALAPQATQPSPAVETYGLLAPAAPHRRPDYTDRNKQGTASQRFAARAAVR